MKELTSKDNHAAISAKPEIQPQPAPVPEPEPVIRPQTSGPGISLSLRDSIIEAERAEETARQARERAAMRLPVGLD